METTNWNKGVLIPIIVFAIIIGLISSINPELSAVLATGIIILSIAFSVYFPLGFYVCSIVMNVGFTPFQSSALAVITGVVSLIILSRNNKIINGQSVYMKLFLWFIFVLLISLLAGQNATTMSAISTVYTVLIGFAVGCYLPKNKEQYISYPLLFGGIVVMYLVYQTISSGTAYEFDATTGRLRYGDSVRILANALAFPVYFSFIKTIENIRRKKPIKNVIWLVVALACMFFLFLTVSRGVIFAVLIALVYVFVKTVRTGGNSKFLIIIVVAVAVYFISSMTFNQNYMLNGLDTMTGRDVIWGFYLSEMINGGIITILFGFGPSAVSRLSASSVIEGAYAHSLVLDYLFRFGVLGFLYLLTLVSYIGYKLIKKNVINYMGLLIMAVLMFASHGSVNTPLFYFLVGMCIGRTLIPEKSTNYLIVK